MIGSSRCVCATEMVFCLWIGNEMRKYIRFKRGWSNCKWINFSSSKSNYVHKFGNPLIFYTIPFFTPIFGHSCSDDRFILYLYTIDLISSKNKYSVRSENAGKIDLNLFDDTKCPFWKCLLDKIRRKQNFKAKVNIILFYSWDNWILLLQIAIRFHWFQNGINTLNCSKCLYELRIFEAYKIAILSRTTAITRVLC